MKGDKTMKTDNTFVQNQYGQDQIPPQGQGYNDTDRGYGQPPHPQQQQSYGAAGGAGQYAQQGHGQPIYVVDEHRSTGDHSAFDFVLYIVAILLPPAAVVIKRGCGGQFWLNVFLTLLGFLPGLIHAFYIVAVTAGTCRKPPRRR